MSTKTQTTKKASASQKSRKEIWPTDIEPNLKAGDKVTTSGYPGTIIRHYSGNMYEVRLERGIVCVDISDIKKASVTPEIDATEHDCPECGEHFSTCICKAQGEPELPQHSPLPWHVSTNAAFPDNAEIRRRTGYRVADCDTPNAVANAKLIVRAVNHAEALAEALRAMVPFTKHAHKLVQDKVFAALAQWEAGQ